MLLAGFVGALLWVGSRLGTADVTVLRGIGAPFVEEPDGRIRNQLRVKVENRTPDPHDYRIEILNADGLDLIAPENPLHVPSGTHETTTLFVLAPRAKLSTGIAEIQFRVSDGAGFSREVPYKLLGPMGGGR